MTTATMAFAELAGMIVSVAVEYKHWCRLALEPGHCQGISDQHRLHMEHQSLIRQLANVQGKNTGQK